MATSPAHISPAPGVRAAINLQVLQLGGAGATGFSAAPRKEMGNLVCSFTDCSIECEKTGNRRSEVPERNFKLVNSVCTFPLRVKRTLLAAQSVALCAWPKRITPDTLPGNAGSPATHHAQHLAKARSTRISWSSHGQRPVRHAAPHGPVHSLVRKQAINQSGSK